jgi:hypothetical protein
MMWKHIFSTIHNHVQGELSLCTSNLYAIMPATVMSPIYKKREVIQNKNPGNKTPFNYFLGAFFFADYFEYVHFWLKVRCVFPP